MICASVMLNPKGFPRIRTGNADAAIIPARILEHGEQAVKGCLELIYSINIEPREWRSARGVSSAPLKIETLLQFGVHPLQRNQAAHGVYAGSSELRWCGAQ